MKTFLTLVIIVLVGALGAFGYMHYKDTRPLTATTTPAGITTATYACADGKTLQASFTADQATLVLSDGRTLTLPHAMSASGARYESGEGSAIDVVFWDKGGSAFLTENTATTYSDCVANASADATPTSDGSRTFTDTGHTFSLDYPQTVTVFGADPGYTTSWMQNATTSGLLLARLDLEKDFEPKTNLSGVTLTVGTSADPSAVASCLTYNPTGGPALKATKETVNGTTYTVFTASDAGAGNLYETKSYRAVKNSQCYAIEYTIHSTNIGNYSPDQGITAYDRSKVEAVFQGIVGSFRFL